MFSLNCAVMGLLHSNSLFQGLFCYIDFPFQIRVNRWTELVSFTQRQIFAFKIKIIFSSRVMLDFSSHIFYPKTACNSETNDKSIESSKIGHAISISARADLGWPYRF